MNIKEFIDSVKAGLLGEVDIYRYLNDVDRRALQDLYDRVYIAAVACVNEIGQGHGNLSKASTIIAKYAKEGYNLSVDWFEEGHLGEIHNLKEALTAHLNEEITNEQLFEWMGIEKPNDEDLMLHQKYSSKLPILEEWNEPQHSDNNSNVVEHEQQQAKQDIPLLRDSQQEIDVFGKALQKGYMSLCNGGYKWHEPKSLLAYMCGRLYCGDRIKENSNDYSEEYKKGRTNLPKAELKALFGIDVGANRDVIKAPPRGHWKIDDLF